MNSVAVVADVVEAFKPKGFKFVGKTGDGWFKLWGLLIPPDMDKGCPCEVQLDPTFFELPRIRLLEHPLELPKAVPHLGAEGSLCYLAKGTVVLDIYDPVGQSLVCLQRAAAVLGQILKDEMIEDLAEDSLPTGMVGFVSWTCMATIWGGRTASSRELVKIHCASSRTTKIEPRKS